MAPCLPLAFTRSKSPGAMATRCPFMSFDSPSIRREYRAADFLSGMNVTRTRRTSAFTSFTVVGIAGCAATEIAGASISIANHFRSAAVRDSFANHFLQTSGLFSTIPRAACAAARSSSGERAFSAS